MDVRIFDTAVEAGRAVARRAVELLRRRPDLVMALPGGRTPSHAYAELRRLHEAGEVDFSRATVFLLDEFLGIGASHRGSFRRHAMDELLAAINLEPARIHALNGLARDAGLECRRYEEAIARAGGLGLVLLGLGANGHIAFNEPAEALVAGSHRVSLLDSTRRDNARLFGGDLSQVPREALTMGIATILHGETIIVMANGAGKAVAVEKMVRGRVTTGHPASLLQLHRRVEAHFDRAAASSL